MPSNRKTEHEKISSFLMTVCEQIRCKKVHTFIARELRAHIEDCADNLMSKGLKEEEAWEKAVIDMGDPVLVGQQLDRTHRPKIAWSIIFIVTLLITIGLAVQFIMQYKMQDVMNNQNLFSSFLIALPIGLLLSIAMYFIDYTTIGRYALFIYGLFFAGAVLLCLPTWYGLSVGLGMIYSNGAFHHMFYFSLLLVPAYGGVIYRLRGKGFKGLLLTLSMGLLPTALALYLGDFLSAVMFSLCSAVLVLAALIKNWFTSKGLTRGKALSVTAVFAAITTVPLHFLYIDQQGNHLFQAIQHVFSVSEIGQSGGVSAQLKSILANAKMYGTNHPQLLDQSLDAQDSLQQILPLWFADYNLAYWICRFGYIVAIILALFVIFLLVRMLLCVFRQRNYLGFILSLSITLVMAVQCGIYFLVNLAILDMPAAPLPFITRGKAILVINMLFIGCFLSIYRNTDLVREPLSASEQAEG